MAEPTYFPPRDAGKALDEPLTLALRRRIAPTAASVAIRDGHAHDEARGWAIVVLMYEQALQRTEESNAH